MAQIGIDRIGGCICLARPPQVLRGLIENVGGHLAVAATSEDDYVTASKRLRSPFDIEERVIRAPRGMLGHIREWGRREKHEIVVNGASVAPITVDRLPNSSAARQLMAAMTENEEATIFVKKEAVIPMLAEVAARLRQRVLIVAPNITMCEELYGVHLRFCPANIRHCRRTIDIDNNTTIATLDYAAKAALHAEVVLVIRPTRLVKSANWESFVERVGRARLFALVTDDDSPHEFGLVSAQFGPVVLEIASAHHWLRPVEQQKRKFYHKTYRGRPQSLSSCLRQNVYRNDERNKLIEKLAREIEREGMAAENGRTRPQRIAIVTPSRAQAKVLSRNLPDYQIVGREFVSTSNPRWFRDRVSPQVGRGRPPRNWKAIVSISALSQCRSLDTVIRADGGIGELDLYRARQTRDEAARPFRLVDIDDRNNPVLRRRFRTRHPEQSTLQAAPESIRTHVRQRRRRSLQRIRREYGYVGDSLRRGLERQRRSEPSGTVTGSVNGDEILSRENLAQCGLLIRTEKGQAAGTDGISPVDCSNAVIYELAGRMSSWVLGYDGRPHALQHMACIFQSIPDTSWQIRSPYRPRPVRRVQVKKKAGGHREIAVMCFQDRMVAMALDQAIRPLIDPLFLDTSFGFREGRGTIDMLASIITSAEKENAYGAIIASNDIKGAFDNVDTASTLEAIRTLLGRAVHQDIDPIMTVVEALLTDGGNRTKGIAQGNPLSPLALNCVLHQHLDAQMDERIRHVRFHRYADDLVLVGRSVSECQEEFEEMERRLQQIGLQYKDDTVTAKLDDGETISILGVSLRKSRNRIRLTLPSETWEDLAELLEETHETPNPPQAARNAINGWIGYFGMALEMDSGLPKLLQMTRQRSLEASVTTQEIRRWIKGAKKRWQRALTRARERSRQGALETVYPS